MTGYLALLDLPKGSWLCIDGQPITLQRDDFVGFHSIPDDMFHLFLSRAGPPRESAAPASITTGIVSFRTEIIRRYDKQTEEVALDSVDATTKSNLEQSIASQSLSPERIVAYEQLVTRDKQQTWKSLTNFITPSILRKRGVASGSKVVPGSYEEETTKDQPKDGASLRYPPVAVLDDRDRNAAHEGTKAFVSRLSPVERTAIFTADNPADIVLDYVVQNYYNDSNEMILGDLQLSYVMFLYLQCFASLEHWRDLLAMLSRVSQSRIADDPELYASLVDVISAQLLTMEATFFEDIEFSGENFLVPSLKLLVHSLAKVDEPALTNRLDPFTNLLRNRFPESFEETRDLFLVAEVEGDEEDGPVVLSLEEVEAALARSNDALGTTKAVEYPSHICKKYAILFAAKLPHEDILMTCARALDDKNDVSLVREAAAYLEEIEAKATTNNS